ncbi:hypothetical protein LBMAG42_45910 [Deltaproteobacteria bacterium]|nr:hypothetical protein LBMAG42_45910 [Deltaproteobacteria bacterium]
MLIEHNRWTEARGWESGPLGRLGEGAQLVLLFGSRALLGREGQVNDVQRAFPGAHVVGCSTAGEIHGTEVSDDSLVLTAVRFEHTRVATAKTRIEGSTDGYGAGRRLGRSLPQDGLVHVFVLSDGLGLNGSELVRGLTETLPPEVSLTGGLSGDGASFAQTVVLCDGAAESNVVAAVGFYGARLEVGYASQGGWDQFGPERLITRAQGNVLYELDRRSALDLYKSYLGAHSAGLPATGLLFPLSLRTADGQTGLVRTILAVNEAEGSMTFAGDMPEGAYARLMRANFDRLIDGSTGAARSSSAGVRGEPDLAVLISCVGRKLVLKQRIEEEVEGVRDVLGAGTVLTGFYSYGEISPFTPGAKCSLHNQTMTITTFKET